jgi:fatty acid desaturase
MPTTDLSALRGLLITIETASVGISHYRVKCVIQNIIIILCVVLYTCVFHFFDLDTHSVLGHKCKSF